MKSIEIKINVILKMMKPYKNQYKTQDLVSKESKKTQGKLHKHGF